MTVRDDVNAIRDQELTVERLARVLNESFEVDPAKVVPEARLYEDLGIDSIDAVDLMLKLQLLTGLKVRPEQFRSVRTVSDVIEVLDALSNKG